MKTELLNKITMKGIGAQPKVGSFAEATGEKDANGDPVYKILPPVVLAVLFGRITDWGVAQSNYGDSIRFVGAFEARSPDGEKVYKSTKCFVPSVVEGLLQDAIANAPEGTSIDFALKIGAKHSNSNRGYEYTVEPLVEVRESDELNQLRELSLAALPAPESKPEPTPTEKKGKK